MNLNIVNIITSCNTLHMAEEEVSKKFFLIRGKYEREVEELREKIKQKIKELENDEWDVKYIIDLEQTLLVYWDYIAKDLFKNGIAIPHNPEVEQDPSVFLSIYFKDQKSEDKTRLIILDVIGSNIDFTIFDPSTGNSFSVTSVDTVQPSQKKIEKICKKYLINSLISYVDRYKNSK